MQVVLETYALMLYDRQAHDSSSPALHRSAHVDHAHYYLETFIADLIRAEVQNRTAEVSMNSADLARYCIYAMDAASSLSSRDAVPVLVDRHSARDLPLEHALQGLVATGGST